MLMQCKSLRYLTFKSMHRLFDNCIKLGNGISVVQNIFIYTHASYHRNSRLLFDFMMFIFPMKWHMIAFFFLLHHSSLCLFNFHLNERRRKKNLGKKTDDPLEKMIDMEYTQKKMMNSTQNDLLWLNHGWIPLTKHIFDLSIPSRKPSVSYSIWLLRK